MWKLSPFFGETTSDYAVVLAQPQNTGEKVECTIFKDGKALSFHMLSFDPEKYCQRWVFDLSGPGFYLFSWTFDSISFYEHRLEISPLRKIIFVSCDFVEADCKKSLWRQIQKEVMDPTYLIHLGDQVYADNAFRLGERLLASGMEEDLAKDQVQREYANRYVKTWSRYNQVLSNCSNLFLWDDHEIVNNFCFKTASPTEAMIGSWGEEIYAQFQEQAFLHPPESHDWTTKLEDLTFLAFQRNTSPTSVKEVLTRLKALPSAAKKVGLLFSSGPVPKPQGFTGSFYRLLTGESSTKTDKFWAPHDLAALYDGVCDWLDEDPERKIVIIGGDLHFAVYGQVTRGPSQFYVIISSPVSNHPSVINKLAAKSIDVTAIGSCTFTPFITEACRCYAMIDPLRFPEGISLRFSKETRPRSWRKFWATKRTFA